MSTVVVESGPDWQILWDGCVQCGAPTPCPQWIVASASAGRPVRTCELFPCFCLATKANAPDFVEDPQCFWRSKKTGRLESRCPCWGRRRDDELPEDCCSRHEANPQYAVEHLEAGIRRPVGDALPNAAPGEAPEHTETDIRRMPTPTGRATSYTRRWTHEELHCDCKTPWDGSKTASGHHCVNCHTNWVNASTAAVHQSDVRHPCRDPKSIVDVDTRRPVLYARDVRGARVWAFIW